jgi:hypothetical protein
MDKPTKMVRVVWVDAETIGDNGWQELDEVQASIETPPPLMKTVGFLLGIHTIDGQMTHVSVTDSIGDKECGHVTKIPMCMIRSMVYLKENDDGEADDS